MCRDKKGAERERAVGRRKKHSFLPSFFPSFPPSFLPSFSFLCFVFNIDHTSEICFHPSPSLSLSLSLSLPTTSKLNQILNRTQMRFFGYLHFYISARVLYKVQTSQCMEGDWRKAKGKRQQESGRQSRFFLERLPTELIEVARQALCILKV
jgi:hypothetical protein